ncbi:uncharacterized protein F54H12.2-like [Panonychus citri]|nr:uncharacterized protein F54H12.2-like [Panonychus citri]
MSAVPIAFRFTKSSDGFALVRSDDKKYKIKINYVSLHIKRVKLFPDAALSVIKGLETAPAKYFITRNETRCFTIGPNLSAAAVENVFSGILPRRVIIGFVDEAAFSGSYDDDPFIFKNYNINFLALYVDGNMIPSIPYTPNFTEGFCMREFVNLYRFMNQDEGHPQMQITYDQFKENRTLFAFDLSPDGSIGAENGTLSLIRRGIIRLQVKFSRSIAQPIKAIIFGQFDNLITIDENRTVTLDY